MVKKLAIDWDESELRLVAAQCSGQSVKVTDASVIPVENGNVTETLKAAIQRRGLENTDTLVAIGRGKAELRELQLPPVPDEELPDMVRFQAIRSFATAGDNAVVDYLTTNRSDSGVEMIAAAVGPQSLAEIQKTCESVSLNTKRISLRPLAAAALYLVNRDATGSNDTVLIDLLADDAEIVVAREGRVIFVRTVRMPSVDAARGRALAGELKRSLVACGSSGSLDRVILWGRENVHADDVEMLAEASQSKVEVLDPFTLVDVDKKASADMPDHVGRLAPLVGLLVADETAADRLVDFLNPRERVEEKVTPYKNMLIAGIPVAIAALLAFFIYRQIKGLDDQIAELKAENASMKPAIDQADESIARTETVDKFLDANVNWLSEIRRLAKVIPPSDELIVRSVSATSDVRSGGGTITIDGAVTHTGVIDRFEDALRDEFHSVRGDGASVQKTEDAYRWGFTEAIRVSPELIRNERYAAMLTSAASDSSVEEVEEQNTEENTEQSEEATAGDIEQDAAEDETQSAGDSPPDTPPDRETATAADSSESQPLETSEPADSGPSDPADSDANESSDSGQTETSDASSQPDASAPDDAKSSESDSEEETPASTDATSAENSSAEDQEEAGA